MSRFPIPLIVVALLVAGAANAAAGTRTLLSHKLTCRITVPADWKSNPVIRSAATAPDGSIGAVISSGAPDTTLAFAKKVMQGSYPPRQVLEDTPRRLSYVYDAGGGKLGIYVGVPGNHAEVCGAQITFARSREAQARQIALSVGPVP
ncbi:MAG TPA: hypothetical protein VJ862_07910 [Rhodanobacteraceae bacterium]|nr:hypothetical protein [Rhodanobacteraceae bacterium]